MKVCLEVLSISGGSGGPVLLGLWENLSQGFGDAAAWKGDVSAAGC